MAKFGVSETIVYGNLSCDTLIKSIDRILRDKKYTEKAENFAEMAEEIQGRKKAAEILRDYSARLQYF